MPGKHKGICSFWDSLWVLTTVPSPEIEQLIIIAVHDSACVARTNSTRQLLMPNSRRLWGTNNRGRGGRGHAAQGQTMHHSVRVCKDRLGIRVDTQTIITFPHRVVVINTTNILGR